MTHAQIDDRFDDHPKYAEYGAAEMGVIACAIVYANRNLTDGKVPRVWPRRRFGQTGERIAKRLISDGIWTQIENDCYAIVGFLDHNPSRAEVLARRLAASQRKASAGRQGGIQSGLARRLSSDDESYHGDSEANAKQTVEATAKQSTSNSLKQNVEANEALSSPLLSSPLHSMEKREEKEDLSRTAPGGFRLEAPKSSPKQAEPAKPPTGDHAKVMAHYSETYTAMFGQKPVIDAADGQWVKRALKNIGLESTLSAIDAWFSDEFNSTKMSSLRKIDLNVAMALDASRQSTESVGDRVVRSMPPERPKKQNVVPPEEAARRDKQLTALLAGRVLPEGP